MQALKSPDSDSGLKSDNDSWNCVIVTVYWVNDEDRQIVKFLKK